MDRESYMVCPGYRRFPDEGSMLMANGHGLDGSRWALQVPYLHLGPLVASVPRSPAASKK